MRRDTRIVDGDRAKRPRCLDGQNRVGQDEGGGLFLVVFGLIGTAIIGIFWLLTRGV